MRILPEIDAKYIQLQGREEFDKDLAHGDKILVEVEVIDVTYPTNDDGTVKEVFKCKLVPLDSQDMLN